MLLSASQALWTDEGYKARDEGNRNYTPPALTLTMNRPLNAKLIKAAAETKNKYYNYNCLLSYNKVVNLVIKERGYGGTLGMKRLGVQTFRKEGREFVWLRLNDVDVDQMCENKGAKFFSDLHCVGIDVMGEIGAENGPKKALITDGTIKIDGKTAGYVKPLWAWEQLKGNDYNNVKWIFLDEFISPDHKRIGFNVEEALANMCETIMRTRPDVRIIMCANSLSKNNQLLRALGFGNINEFGLYVNRHTDKALDKMAILHYAATSTEYKQLHANSAAGKIARLLNQEGVILNNEFKSGNNQYLDPSKKRPFMILDSIIHAKDDSFRVYRGGENDCHLYIMEDKLKLAYMGFRQTFDKKLVNQYIKFAPKQLKDYYFMAAQGKALIFENEYIEDIFYSIL